MNDRGKETSQRILAAALEEFSDLGYHGARVDSIARKAGVNKQRIYAYFGSKEALFSDVLKECFEGIVERESALESLCDADMKHMAGIILRHYMDFHIRNPHFWRLVARENLGGGAHMLQLKDVRRRTLDHIRKLYGRAQESGVFRKDVSFETFFYVLSALPFFYFSNQRTMTHILDIDMSDPAVRDRLVAESLAMLSLDGA